MYCSTSLFECLCGANSLYRSVQTYLTMIPAITSFLPPTHTHLYIPALFKIWEAFNSAIVDDRMINLVGELSEEHVAGTAGDAGAEGGAPWKDVGIWTQEEWTVLIGKALGSMSMRPLPLIDIYRL